MTMNKKRNILQGIRNSINFFICCYYKIFKSSRTFMVGGHAYKYFYHMYNRTWKNERAVEVSFVMGIVKKYQGENILEVGNVLSNYSNFNHDILDKYEKGVGVINEDAADFNSDKKYNLIISISTFEHVGWDGDEPKEPNKILRAVENMEACLAPGGEIIITVPVGYNSYLDKLLEEGKIRFTRTYYLKRISQDNKWIEADWKNIKNVKYNNPFRGANGLVIGIVEKA